MNYQSIFNLVLPKSLQNENIEKKSINWGWLICAYLQLISTFIFFIAYSTVLFIDVYSSISLFIATIIQIVNIWIMLKSEQRPINLNLGNISLIFAIFIPAFQNGGISFPPLSWSITCIVYSAFLHKRNHFISWLIIFSLLFVLLYFFSPVASIESINQFKIDSFIHRFFSTLTVAFQVYIFSFVQKVITNEKIEIQKLQENLLNENRNLLRIISHDVATPLTVLGISLKKISSDDALQKRSIERATTAVMAIKDTLEEVRNWQSIKDGKLKIDLQEVLLDDVVFSTLDLYSEKNSR